MKGTKEILKKCVLFKMCFLCSKIQSLLERWGQHFPCKCITLSLKSCHCSSSQKCSQLAWSLGDICQEFRKGKVWKVEKPSELTVKEQVFQYYFWFSSTVHWRIFLWNERWHYRITRDDTTESWNKLIWNMLFMETYMFHIFSI